MLALGGLLVSGCGHADEHGADLGTSSEELAEVNLARGRPVTASSYEAAGLEPANAVDGSLSSRWSSLARDPQWIQVDLGATYTLSRVRISWETAYARAFKVQISADGASFSDLYSTTTNAALTNDLTTLAAIPGRYLRVYGTARATQWGYSIFELEAYGASSGGGTGGGTSFTVTPTALASTTEVPNPLKGFHYWDPQHAFWWPGQAQPAGFYYGRFSAWEVITGGTFNGRNAAVSNLTYNWSEVDRIRDMAEAQRMPWGIRIMTFFTGDSRSSSAMPVFMRVYGAGGDVSSWSGNLNIGTWWVPDWNSEAYLSMVEQFWAAFKARYQTPGGTKYSRGLRMGDTGFWGNWGEQHHHPLPTTGTYTAKNGYTWTLGITQQNATRINNAAINAMPGVIWLVNKPEWQSHTQAAAIAALQRTGTVVNGAKVRVGWRADHGGATQLDEVTSNSLFDAFESAIINTKHWAKAPVVCEPAGKLNASGMALLSSQADKYHFATTANGNQDGSFSSHTETAQQAWMDVGRKSGYRIKLDKAVGSLSSGTLSLAATWSNSGNSPVYEDWDVVYQFRDSSGRVVQEVTSSLELGALVPSSAPATATATDTLAVPAGTHDLVVLVRDPSGYYPPMNLAQTGRRSDGSYLIRAAVSRP